MDELELIALLTRDLPTNESVVAGAGDDCALIDVGIPGRVLAFKTDAVVEGVHFTAETDPEKVGHKALGRVLSDFAAAAATPTAALVTLGLPPGFDSRWAAAVYDGLKTLARRWQVAIVGGETTTCPERAFLSIAAVGTVARDRTVRRSGARVGDAIFVSGELGGSLVGRHLEFEPRLAEAHWLTEHFAVHAMIDVSDGLATDLRHILKASGAGAEILREAIPLSRAARERARKNLGGKTAWAAALTDGEDFELLFTVASGDAVPVLDGWRARFPEVRLSCIGRMTAGAGLRLRDSQGTTEIAERGYTHFS
jgi:thiamine-monophosphate kinase